MRLLKFRQWPILTKIIMISIVSVSLMTAVIIFYFMPLIEQKVMEGKKEGVKNVVDVAFGVFLEYDALIKNGRISPKEARELVKQRIGALRYDEKEYFWINDLHPIMIMHPIRPELDGKDLTENQDPNGQSSFSGVCESCQKQWFRLCRIYVAKTWRRRPVPKISYVRLYEPWGWILGSGIYVDDVKKDLTRLRFYLLVGTLLFTVLTLVFASYHRHRHHQAAQEGDQRPAGYCQRQGERGAHRKDCHHLYRRDRHALLRIQQCNGVHKQSYHLQEGHRGGGVRGRSLHTPRRGVHVDIWVIQDCIIYMITGSTNEMIIAYPSMIVQKTRSVVNQEILSNCDLCKARKTGHIISSLTYPSICRQFAASIGQGTLLYPVDRWREYSRRCAVRLRCPPGITGDSSTMKTNVFKAEQYINETLPVIETKRLMNTLHESALSDPLTGLHNRRYLQEYTENIVAGVVRRGKAIGLIMCDLDYFKQVNDTYGHDVGDIVLQQTAKVYSTRAFVSRIS